jgi:hypothetical protein
MLVGIVCSVPQSFLQFVGDGSWESSWDERVATQMNLYGKSELNVKNNLMLYHNEIKLRAFFMDLKNNVMARNILHFIISFCC